MENGNKTFSTLNELLESVNLEEVTAESNEGYENLPNGYYLAEVVKAELTTSKSSGLPMVALQLRTIEDGVKSTINAKGFATMENVDNTKGKAIFKYYVMKDETSLKKFVADMLKFETAPDEPVLGKEYFTTEELIEDALQILVEFQIYVQVSSSKNKDGESATWYNLISWKRANALGLS